MDIPFTLASFGYKADPENPNRFIHPDGHPFYAVEFENPELRYTMDDCMRAIAQSAYTRGSKQAEASCEPELRHCNTCGFQIAIGYGACPPIEGFPRKGPMPLAEDENKLRVENTKAECMNDRRKAGLPTSRTCGLCGLGPCARDNLP